MKLNGIRSAVFAVIMLVLGSCAAPLVNLYLGPSTEEVRTQAAWVKPPSWKLPLGPAAIEHLQFLPPGRILVAEKQIDEFLSNRPYLLVDAASGNVLWRFTREERGDYDILLADEERILFSRTGMDGKATVTSIGTPDGKALWSLAPVSPSPLFLPFPEERLLCTVERGKERVRLAAHDLASGKELWSREMKVTASDGLPLPLLLPNGIVHFYGKTEMVSPRDGRTIWSADNTTAGRNSPPARFREGAVALVDASRTLQVLAADTGKVLMQLSLELSATNIVLSPDTVYVRGKADGARPYLITAIRRSDGKTAWTYGDSAPSVSPILEERDRVYVATASTLICLDRTSGKELFRAAAASTGRTFPVQLVMAGDKVVFISELVVAGFDPLSGKEQYSHGVTPIKDLDSLDLLIKQREKELTKIEARPAGFDWSGYYANQAVNYQNMARSYERRAEQLRSEADWSRRYGGSQYSVQQKYIAAQYQGIQARISRSFENVQAIASMQAAAMQLGEAIQKAQQLQELEGSIAMHRFLMKVILASSHASQEGDIVVRPHTKGKFSGIAIVHLPTGTYRFFSLSPSYQEYGLWSLVDLNKGIVYHHGMGMEPADYSVAQPFTYYSRLIKVRMYNSFLIAQPVDLPKQLISGAETRP